MTKGEDLCKTAMENDQQINDFNTLKTKLEDETRKEEYYIKWDVYEPKIDALKHERDQKLKDIEQSKNLEIENIDAKIKTLMLPIKQIRRILKFLKLSKIDEKKHPQNIPMEIIEPENLKLRNGDTLIDLGFLVKDEYLNLRCFIVRNDKPVNCFSLIVMGNTYFYDSFDYSLLEKPQSNMSNQWQNAAYLINGSARIDQTLKTASDIEELKQWYNKNKTKIFVEFLTEYEKVKAEYKEVLENYSLDDFRGYTL